MEVYACSCAGLPPHDHYIGQAPDANGVWGPVWDTDDVGRLWVDWRAIARVLIVQGPHT